MPDDSLRIVLCDAAPPRDALDPVLRAYYALIVTRMAGMGFALDPAAPESALAEFWADPGAYLPPRGCLALAETPGGEILGVGMLKRLDDATGELKRLYVMDRARGSGAGRGLVEARIAAARRMGLARVVADTLTPNVEMRALYARMGFREVAEPIETTTYKDQPMLRPHLHYFVMDLAPAERKAP